MPDDMNPRDGLNRPEQAVSQRKWPATEGRYRIGNASSPIAVCTMASVDVELPMDNIAIVGKCVTENLGLEKVIKNTISNPNIRFIVMCGKDSNGHYVGQAIQSLKDKGIDSEKRIIGARGAMPILKNLSNDEIEMFRKQVEPIDMTGETDNGKILARINELNERNPGPFEDSSGGSNMMENEIKEVRAETHPMHEWVKDPQGFFTICPESGKKEIIVEHHGNDGKIKTKIFGRSAEDLYHHIIKTGLVSRHDHAAYLGRELSKAESAMKNLIDYEQDADLKIRKENNLQKESSVPERRPEPVSNESKVFPRAVKPKPFAIIHASPVRKNIRILTYIKGLKEIELEDVSAPDNEFRALLRSKGLSRVF